MIKLFKIILITITVLLLGTNLMAQTTSIEIGYPIAYPGIENNMKIIVENINCENIYAEAEKGIIKLGENPCEFKLLSKSIGEEYIKISRININDTTLIEKRRIIVKKWPDQPAEFGKKQGGEMSKSEFLIHNEVVARISGFDMSGKHKVKSYEITVTRGDSLLYTIKNYGGEIGSENLRKLKNIKQNDIIEFTKIMAYIVGEKEPRKLNDIKITIKN